MCLKCAYRTSDFSGAFPQFGLDSRTSKWVERSLLYESYLLGVGKGPPENPGIYCLYGYIRVYMEYIWRVTWKMYAFG